jgi:hypothetical protein
VKVAGIEGIAAGFRTASAKLLLLLRYRFEVEAQLHAKIDAKIFTTGGNVH